MPKNNGNARALRRKAADRMVSEKELQVSEEKYRRLLESAPDAIVGTNELGRIVFVNAQLENLFRYKRDELLGQPVEIFIPEGFRKRHVGHRADYLSNPQIRRMGVGMELHGLRKDGSQFPVEISLSPMKTEDGFLVVSIIRDLTERKQLEGQLLQSQKMEAMGRLVAGVAHDFNNLLVVIRGHSSFLRNSLSLDEGLAGTAEQIEEAVDRAATLIQQLLVFGPRQVFQPRVLELSTVVSSTSILLR